MSLVGGHTSERVIRVDKAPVVKGVTVVLEGVVLLERISISEVEPLAFTTVEILARLSIHDSEWYRVKQKFTQ
jgi:hypothetical protein